MLSNVVLGCGCGLGGEISGKGDIFQRRGVAGKHQGLMCNRFGVRFGRLGTEVVGITGASSTRRRSDAPARQGVGLALGPVRCALMWGIRSGGWWRQRLAGGGARRGG